MSWYPALRSVLTAFCDRSCEIGRDLIIASMAMARIVSGVALSFLVASGVSASGSRPKSSITLWIFGGLGWGIFGIGWFYRVLLGGV